MTLAGLVVGLRQNRTQRGDMASVVLDDRSGRIEATFFSDAFDEYRSLLAVDQVLLVTGRLSYDEYRGGLSLRASHAQPLEQARSLKAKAIRMELDETELEGRSLDPTAFCQQLQTQVEAFRGQGCQVVIQYQSPDARGLVRLGDSWRLKPTDELLRRLEQLPGVERVWMDYGQEAPSPVADA